MLLGLSIQKGSLCPILPVYSEVNSEVSKVTYFQVSEDRKKRKVRIKIG